MLAARVRTARSAFGVKQHVRHMMSNREALAAPPVSRSLLDQLFNRSSMPAVPLNHAYPGVPGSTMIGEPAAEAFPTQTTTLPNGLRIVSVGSNYPVARVSAFVAAGSRVETLENSGTSNFLAQFAFKSTENRSEFKMVRDMQQVGASYGCTASRDNMEYSVESLKEYLPVTVQTLADVIQNPAFETEELHDFVPMYKKTIQERSAEVQISEAIHAAAYHQNTLGLPLYPTDPEDAIFTKETLSAYMQKFYSPSSMVISAVGVDHATLVDLVSKEFNSLPPAPKDVPMETAKYTGGDVRLYDVDEAKTHIALAFQAPGLTAPDLVSMLVLEKSLNMRLSKKLEGAVAHSAVHSDSSTFGAYATCSTEKSGEMVDTLSSELIAASQVGEEELTLAKKQLKLSWLMELDNRGALVESFGRQMLATGKTLTNEDIVTSIDAVTAADVKKTATGMLKTPVSLAAFGDTSATPRYGDISKRFG